jgi:cytidine deaminase
MKAGKTTKRLTIEFEEYAGISALPESDLELLQGAIKERDNAHAPYSGFRVGASAMLENGLRVAGSNQENASFPAGLCAERVTLFTSMGSHPGVRVNSLAVSAQNKSDNLAGPVYPCGFCAQVLVDLEERQQSDIRIILGAEKGTVIVLHSAKSILPFFFSSKEL